MRRNRQRCYDNRVARQRLVAKRFSPDIKAHWCGLCQYCLKEKATTIDHIMPIKRGGKDHLDNLLPACEPCNSKKASHRLHPELEEEALEKARQAVKPIKARYHQRLAKEREREAKKAAKLLSPPPGKE